MRCLAPAGIGPCGSGARRTPRADSRFSSVAKVNFAEEGFYTEDKRWICEACYDYFKVLFDWRLES